MPGKIPTHPPGPPPRNPPHPEQQRRHSGHLQHGGQAYHNGKYGELHVSNSTFYAPDDGLKKLFGISVKRSTSFDGNRRTSNDSLKSQLSTSLDCINIETTEL